MFHPHISEIIERFQRSLADHLSEDVRLFSNPFTPVLAFFQVSAGFPGAIQYSSGIPFPGSFTF